MEKGEKEIMDRRTLQVIGIPIGIKVKVSFNEDDNDHWCGSYSNIKINRTKNGNLTFLIPIGVLKVTVATHYNGVDYAIVGQKIEEKIVTRIFFEEWIRKEKADKFPRECKHCGIMLEHIVQYEIHQCPSEEKK